MLEPCPLCPNAFGLTYHPADRPHGVGLGLIPCAAPGCDQPEDPSLPAGLCRDHIVVVRSDVASR